MILRGKFIIVIYYIIGRLNDKHKRLEFCKNVSVILLTYLGIQKYKCNEMERLKKSIIKKIIFWKIYKFQNCKNILLILVGTYLWKSTYDFNEKCVLLKK